MLSVEYEVGNNYCSVLEAFFMGFSDFGDFWHHILVKMCFGVVLFMGSRFGNIKIWEMIDVWAGVM